MATEQGDRSPGTSDDLNLDVNLDDFSLDDEQLFADLDNEVRLDADSESGGGEDELDLDSLGGDLDLDAGGSETAPGGDDLDLGGDLDLGDEGGGADATSGGDDLDLGDLDLELGDESAGAEAASGGDELDLGGDLDLDLGDESGAANAAGEGDELDLGGDLDLDLGDESGGAEAGGSDEDLDLDLGDEGGGADATSGVEDLDLGGDLDLDLGDEGGGASAASGEDIDLDLDLGEEVAETAEGSGSVDDLDLGEEIDLDLGDEGEADAGAGDEGLDLGDELDLGDDGEADALAAAESSDELQLGDEDLELDAEDSDVKGGVEPDLGEISDADLELPEDVDFSMESEEGEPAAAEPSGEMSASLEDGDELAGNEALSMDAGDLDLELDEDEIAGGADFEALPDVDLDSVDLDEVGFAPTDESAETAGEEEASFDLDLAESDEDIGAGAEAEFEAMPDMEIDDAELESLGGLEPPELGMPDPFRVSPHEPADAGDEGWAAGGAHDDFAAAPDVNLASEDVVELNLDDLEQGGGLAAAAGLDRGGRQPARVGEPVELPPDAYDDEEAIAETGAIPSDVLLSIPRKVNVEMGSATLNGRDLMHLAYGSVVQLNQVVGDPVELVLEGRTIAQGEIVLINGRNLGVRILSLRK